MDGIVATFDERQGLGTIEADGTSYPFHCTALVDGSRHAEPGQQVTFRVVPGHCGRWEATEIA